MMVGDIGTDVCRKGHSNLHICGGCVGADTCTFLSFSPVVDADTCTYPLTYLLQIPLSTKCNPSQLLLSFVWDALQCMYFLMMSSG